MMKRKHRQKEGNGKWNKGRRIKTKRKKRKKVQEKLETKDKTMKE